jgi:hypothetical protein
MKKMLLSTLFLFLAVGSIGIGYGGSQRTSAGRSNTAPVGSPQTDQKKQFDLDKKVMRINSSLVSGTIVVEALSQLQEDLINKSEHANELKSGNDKPALFIDPDSIAKQTGKITGDTRVQVSGFHYEIIQIPGKGPTLVPIGFAYPAQSADTLKSIFKEDPGELSQILAALDIVTIVQIPMVYPEKTDQSKCMGVSVQTAVNTAVFSMGKIEKTSDAKVVFEHGQAPSQLELQRRQLSIETQNIINRIRKWRKEKPENYCVNELAFMALLQESNNGECFDRCIKFWDEVKKKIAEVKVNEGNVREKLKAIWDSNN